MSPEESIGEEIVEEVVATPEPVVSAENPGEQGVVVDVPTPEAEPVVESTPEVSASKLVDHMVKDGSIIPDPTIHEPGVNSIYQ